MMSDPGCDSLTLTYVIPTYNRSAFLRRLLGFLWESGLSEPIIIADSSGSAQAEKSKAVFEEYRSRLNVTYIHYELPFVEKCCEVLNRLQSKYVVFCGDDDFLLPAVISECVAFLEKNEDYAIAQGRVVHTSNSHSQSSHVYECMLIDAFDIRSEGAAERLLEMAAKPFSTFYGVHRTALLTDQFEATRRHTEYQAGRVFTESLLIGLSVIPGKIRVLSGIQYVQQTHGTNDSVVLSRIQDRSRRDELYQRYRTALVNALMSKARLAEPEAVSIVDRSVNLVPGLNRKQRSILELPQRLAREFNRVWVRVSRMLDQARGVSKADQGRMVMKNVALIPEDGEYAIVRRLLTEYPQGIESSAVAVAGRQ